MLKGHLNSTPFIKARLAQLVDHQTLDLRVVGSNCSDLSEIGLLSMVIRYHLFSAYNSDFDWFRRNGYTSIHQTGSTATSIETHVSNVNVKLI